MIYTILIFLIIAVCAIIVFLVVIQNSKGGGLASNLQGAAVASQIMGVRRAADVVEKMTWWMIATLVVFAIGANMVLVNSSSSSDKSELRLKGALSGQKINTAPTQAPQPGGGSPAPAPAKEAPAKK